MHAVRVRVHTCFLQRELAVAASASWHMMLYAVDHGVLQTAGYGLAPCDGCCAYVLAHNFIAFACTSPGQDGIT